jgi:thiol-disulfide isomerase/thioredoxin
MKFKSMKKKNCFPYLLMLLFLLFSSSIINSQNKNSYDKKKAENLIKVLKGIIPKKPIEFSNAGFINIEKRKLSISDFKGKVILLNLWATWCPPCTAEMPSLENLYKKFKNNAFTILAVSQGEDLQTVKGYIVKNKFTFPVLIDNKNEIAKLYGTGSIPTTYLIDKEGYKIAGFIGSRDWNSPEVINLINELLK